MPSMQIVFLFDLNAYTNDGYNIDSDFNKKLLCLRLSCLRILTHYFAIEPNLKWGFKFFNSRGSFLQKMSTFSFSSVSLESFEILENEITVRYQRHISYLEALSTSVSNDLSPSDIINKLSGKNETSYPVQVLQHALTQILCEFQWSNDHTSMFSPSKKSRDKHMNKNDILFLVTKCPKKEQNFFDYFGADTSCLTPGKFDKLLLTQSLHEQLLLKSSILWIWLDTNVGNILGNPTEEVLSKLANTLKSLKCPLIPVSIFSHAPSILKCEGNSNQASRMDLMSSLMPFCNIIPQSLQFQFYSHSSKSHPREAVIHFLNMELYVHLIKISMKSNSMDLKLNWSESEKQFFEKASSLTWSKFDFHFAVPKASSIAVYGNFICLPAAYSDERNYGQFQHFNKNLIQKGFNLFITCESTCGVKLPGLFSAFTDTSGLISIISPNKLFEKSSMSISFLTSDSIETSNSGNSENMCLKPFQIECLEPWFKPLNSICAILPSSEEHQNRSSLKSFYKKFSKKFNKEQKQVPENENISPVDEKNEEKPSEATEAFEVSSLSYDELINLLKAEYDLSLNTSHSVLHSAKKIVKTAFSFFKLKSSDTVEDSLKYFLKEFFTVSCSKIIEKYKDSQEVDKKSQECKLQILLALEMEILAPHTERTELIKNIEDYFSILEFISASESIQFFREVLKENYDDSLHDILAEISEDKDFPLSEEEDDSTYETSEPPSSDSMLGSNNSRVSLPSVKSSSSSSSRADSRKVVSRNDLKNNSKNRQFLLTRSATKKKKYKNLCPGAENIPIRYSPRLSSKRKRERNLKCSVSAKSANHVRRNLFPKEQPLITPRCSRSPYKRKRTRTPKSHHVLKTNFVAETPTSKQNLSALQRRKSFMDTDDSETSLTEIAESPKINKNAKNPAQSELLKQLNDLESNKFVQPEPLAIPSCSSQTHYTPESKRRLSIRLFSNYLTSPTARMGLRKCSKRLFDQVSPHVENETYKRLKVDTELEYMSFQKLPTPGKVVETPKKKDNETLNKKNRGTPKKKDNETPNKKNSRTPKKKDNETPRKKKS